MSNNETLDEETKAIFEKLDENEEHIASNDSKESKQKPIETEINSDIKWEEKTEDADDSDW